MTIPLPPEDRRRALRRMKLLAGGLLVVAAAVYVVCRVVGHERGAWGYLQAGAEASMVGGLADWFAVTALFRRPLGLPIPHTALIPRRKDQIGAGLAGFVQEHFLTPELIGERLTAARLPWRVGVWLADPVHAEQVAAQLGDAVQGITSALHDDELRQVVAEFADRRLREAELAPPLARVIDAVCDAGQHQRALTAVLRGLARFLEANKSIFRERFAAESPDWVPEWIDDRVFARGFTAVQKFLADVAADPDHALRAGFDAQLRGYAQRLRTDPDEVGRVEQAKLQLLDHPAVRQYLTTLWVQVKALILTGAGDPDSELRRTLRGLALRTGEALRDDVVLRERVDGMLLRVAQYLVSRHATDVAAVISTTVARWDADETSRRLELQVGRDLQFIRLNGTVVGALAGLLIYALTRWL